MVGHHFKTTCIIRSLHINLCIMMRFSLQSLAFPGITICNLNIIRASQIMNLTSGKDNILRNEMRNTSTLTGVFQSSQTSLSNDELASLQQDDVQSGRSFSFARINLLPLDVLKQAGHQFEEFLTMCSWAGLLCHKG